MNGMAELLISQQEIVIWSVTVSVIVVLCALAAVIFYMYRARRKPAKKAENAEEPKEALSQEKLPEEELPKEEPVKPIEIPQNEVPEEKEKAKEEPLAEAEAPSTESEEELPAQADKLPANEEIQLFEEEGGEQDDTVRGKVLYVKENRLVSVRYDKSFTARIMQTSDQNKAYYSQIKNELLRYQKVTARISWRQESFRRGRGQVAKLEMRGKTLCLYLALNPADYAESKFLVEDASDKKKNEATPCLYRIRSDRRARYAIELIADLFRGMDVKYLEKEPVDYAAQFPYEETKPLVERGLVKLVEERAGLKEESFEEEAAIAETERVEEKTEDFESEKWVRESSNVSVRTYMTVVNVDTLGEYFNDGETVTLEDMLERIPFINRRATYVKVLARGNIDKALVVEADDYSPEAVKMIIRAGGSVYRKRAQ